MTSSEISVRAKDQVLVKSFKDNKFYAVNKKDLKEFEARKYEEKPQKASFEKALAYHESNELPPNWPKSLISDEDPNNEADVDDETMDSEDEKSNLERDNFIAHIYKFNEENGSPISKTPTVLNKEFDLFKFSQLVRKHGGFYNVGKNNKWKYIYSRLGLPSVNAGVTQLRKVYKRYLLSHEELGRKFEGNESRSSGRTRSTTARMAISQREKSKFNDDSDSEEKASMKEGDSTTVSDKLKVGISDPRSEKSIILEPDENKLKRRLGMKEDDNIRKPRTTSSKDEAPGRIILMREKGARDDSKKPVAVKKDEDEKRKRSQRTRNTKDDDEETKFEKRKKLSHDPKSDISNFDSSEHDVDMSNSESSTPKGSNVPEVIPINSRLLVKYGRGRTLKAYDAKVINTEEENDEKFYLVHYAGWNNRYDEWVGREKIVQMLEEGDGKYQLKNTRPFVSPRNKNAVVEKALPGRKKLHCNTAEGKFKTKAGGKANTQTKASRLTRSSSMETAQLPPPPRKGRARKTSSVADNDSQASDVKSTDDSFQTDIDPLGNEATEDESVPVKEEKVHEEPPSLVEIKLEQTAAGTEKESPNIEIKQDSMKEHETKPVQHSELPVKSPGRGRPRSTTKSPKASLSKSRNSKPDREEVIEKEEVPKEEVKLKDQPVLTKPEVKEETDENKTSEEIPPPVLAPVCEEKGEKEIKDEKTDANIAEEKPGVEVKEEKEPAVVGDVDLTCNEVGAVEKMEALASAQEERKETECRLLESVGDNNPSESDAKSLKKVKKTKKIEKNKASADEDKKKRNRKEKEDSNAFTPPYTPPDDTPKSKSASSSPSALAEEGTNNPSPLSNGNIIAPENIPSVSTNRQTEQVAQPPVTAPVKKRRPRLRGRRSARHNSDSDDNVKSPNFHSPSKSIPALIHVDPQQMELTLKKYNLSFGKTRNITFRQVLTMSHVFQMKESNWTETKKLLICRKKCKKFVQFICN